MADSNEVIIRKANIKDIQSIYELFMEIGNIHSRALPDIFTENVGKGIEEIEKLFEDEKISLFVAKLNNGVIGFVQGEIKESPDIPIMVKRKYGVIDTLIVNENCRGKGVGKKLLNTIHQWFIKMEVHNVELNVYDFNKEAFKLYESMGYTGVRRILNINL